LSPTGTRYNANVTEFARRLYEDENYSVNEVVEALGRRGITPSRSTVLYWCDADAREAHNTKRVALYPDSRRRRREASWEVKLRRMRELREVGLSYEAIAKLSRHELGLDIDGETVRTILRGRVSMATAKKRLSVRVES
jgi:intein-encoded DNA endonuclease-like protein